MTDTIRVEEIAAYDGQEVQIKGWVYNRTRKGKLVFLLVRDGSGFVQCVAFKPDLDPELFEQIVRLTHETAVVITGIVRRRTSPYDSPPRYGVSAVSSTNRRCSSGYRSRIVCQSSPSQSPTSHSWRSSTTCSEAFCKSAIASAVWRARRRLLL